MNSNKQRKRAPSGTFTYREYLEFTGAEEFERFRTMEVVSDCDIANVEWDQLLARLISD